MTMARIRTAFESKLNTWAQAQSPALPVAWPNVTFTPPVGSYVRAFLIPSSTASRDIGGKNRSYTGIFQASLFLPIGSGPALADSLAGSLDAAFPVDTQLISGSLRITLTSPMSAAAAVEEPDRYLVPVSCSYRAEDYV